MRANWSQNVKNENTFPPPDVIFFFFLLKAIEEFLTSNTSALTFSGLGNLPRGMIPKFS